MDELTRLIRDEYNPPPPVPRDEMWAAIQAGLEAPVTPVHSLDEARRRRTAWRSVQWAAAATVVLGVGVAIGRMSSPAPAPLAEAPAAVRESAVRIAAVEHLVRTESLLRMARADGSSGRVDPALGSWARNLLGQTRLLLDSSAGDDRAMRDLLEDLELVLMQMAAAGEAQGDEDRFNSELSLALSGLEQREVLPRIQAVVPSGVGMAGT